MGHETRCLTVQSKLRLLLTVAVSALVAGACAKTGETPPVDTTAATTATTETDTVPPLPAISADSMQILTAASNWDNAQDHRYIGPLDCGDGSTCGGKTKVSFRILPHTNAHSIDHRQVLNGARPAAYIARLTNTDVVDYGPWKIDRGATAYLKVGAVVGGQRRIAIYSINPSTGSETLLVTAQDAAICDMKPQTAPNVHPWAPPHCRSAKDKDPLYGNPFAETSVTPKESVAKLASFSLNQVDVDIGLWITCSGGCCEGSRFR